MNLISLISQPELITDLSAKLIDIPSAVARLEFFQSAVDEVPIEKILATTRLDPKFPFFVGSIAQAYKSRLRIHHLLSPYYPPETEVYWEDLNKWSEEIFGDKLIETHSNPLTEIEIDWAIEWITGEYRDKILSQLIKVIPYRRLLAKYKPEIIISGKERSDIVSGREKVPILEIKKSRLYFHPLEGHDKRATFGDIPNSIPKHSYFWTENIIVDDWPWQRWENGCHTECWMHTHGDGI